MSAVVALGTAAGMMAQWPTLALYWYGSADAVRAAAGAVADPIFGRPLAFYLFTLPAWQLVSRLADDARRAGRSRWRCSSS